MPCFHLTGMCVTGQWPCSRNASNAKGASGFTGNPFLKREQSESFCCLEWRDWFKSFSALGAIFLNFLVDGLESRARFQNSWSVTILD